MKPYATQIVTSPTRGAEPLGLPTRALARRCAGALRSRGSLALSLAYALGLRYGVESQMTVRKAAVAGSWYPGSADALQAAVDQHLAAASDAPPAPERLVALIAPHAGLIYS